METQYDSHSQQAPSSSEHYSQSSGPNVQGAPTYDIPSPLRFVTPQIIGDRQPLVRMDPVQNVYNPVPVMTHYNMPVLHHIPINQVVKKYVPVYYPIPVERRINIPVRIPIKVPQRVKQVFLK